MIIRCHLYWVTDLLVGVRVAGLNSKYQIITNPVKILAAHDKTKKNRCLDLFLKQQRHFTQFVVSLYGMLGIKATTLVIMMALKL